jgi:hypothetical protein
VTVGVGSATEHAVHAAHGTRAAVLVVDDRDLLRLRLPRLGLRLSCHRRLVNDQGSRMAVNHRAAMRIDHGAQQPTCSRAPGGTAPAVVTKVAAIVADDSASERAEQKPIRRRPPGTVVTIAPIIGIAVAVPAIVAETRNVRVAPVTMRMPVEMPRRADVHPTMIVSAMMRVVTIDVITTPRTGCLPAPRVPVRGFRSENLRVGRRDCDQRKTQGKKVFHGEAGSATAGDIQGFTIAGADIADRRTGKRLGFKFFTLSQYRPAPRE